MAVTSNKRSVISLFSGNTDPHSHRVRLVLHEKGVTFDTTDTELFPKAFENLAEYNPYGTVPTLVDRDLVLYGSEIIMEYLDERFPHPPLMPVYPVARGRTRLMVHRVNQDWYTLMDKIMQDPADKTLKKELCDSITSVLPVFAELPYFLSEEFSLIDCCIAPLLWRLPKLGVTLPPQAQPILEYAERIFARESFQASLTDAERTMRM